MAHASKLPSSRFGFNQEIRKWHGCIFRFLSPKSQSQLEKFASS